MKGKKLTDKQKRFVKEYLIDSNATQACIRAGYSKKNADKIGPELLGNSRVREAVDKAQQKQSDKLQITAESIINDLSYIKQLCLGLDDKRPEHLDLTNAIKAMQEQCKILGLYSAEKHDVKNSFVITPSQRRDLL
jgi:phage terminase small subunit